MPVHPAVFVEEFIKDMDKIHPVSDGLRQTLMREIEIVELPKRNTLLKEGQQSNYVYFVIKGLLRSYYLKDGIEICARFMHEHHIVISTLSFYTRKPGYEFIETIEDCTLARIHHGTLQKIYEQHIEFNYHARVWTEHYCSMTEQRLFLLRKQSAEARYLYFMEDNPKLMARLPLKYLATYLGMNLETLSRIRRKLSQKN